jgi:hypothetical protein
MVQLADTGLAPVGFRRHLLVHAQPGCALLDGLGHQWSVGAVGAGVGFGSWYVPILWVVILAFFWECFEFSVAGFGDQEGITNGGADYRLC